VQYAFESIGDEPLQILQVECSDVAITSREQLRATLVYADGKEHESRADRREVKTLA
jgi:hypothetical protein